MNPPRPVVKRDKAWHLPVMICVIVVIIIGGAVIYGFSLLDSIKQGTVTPDDTTSILPSAPRPCMGDECFAAP